MISDGVEKVFERCDVIVAASGTVTLQAAIHGTPMVIIYKVSPMSFWLGRALVRVPNIGLVNLVAGEPLVPELVQHEALCRKYRSCAGTNAEGYQPTKSSQAAVVCTAECAGRRRGIGPGGGSCTGVA